MQFKRTVVGPSLVIFVAAAILFGAITAGVIAGDFGIQPVTDSLEELDDIQLSQENEDFVEDVEREFIALLNEERTSQGLQAVTTRQALRAMGLAHSEVMAEAGEIGHRGLGDGTIEERFQQRGLLPECRIDLSGTTFYPGAENAAMYNPGYGSLNAEELAAELFQMWMDSPGHRRPMMAPDLGAIGLGVVEDGGSYYAALEMCGR